MNTSKFFSLFSMLLFSSGGCTPATHLNLLQVQGRIQLSSGAKSGNIYVQCYALSRDKMTGRTTLTFFHHFRLKAPGSYSQKLEFPRDEGEGLVLYAWHDQDGDGFLCAPGQTKEVAGSVEVQSSTAAPILADLTLDQPCAGPEHFYRQTP